VDECRQLGEDFDSNKLLSRFMDGLDAKSNHYEARIESLLAQKNMSQLNASLATITLPYVQSQLLSIDEKRGLTSPSSGFRNYKTGNPYAMYANTNFKPTFKPKPQRTTGDIKCGYKFCGKFGHTTSECRKRKRDEEYKAKSNKRPKTPRTTTPYSKANIRCHKCNTLGHYANECPNKGNEPQQQAHRATVDTKVSRSASIPASQNKTSNRDLDEMIMMAVSDPPTRWNTRPHRPPFVQISGFHDFLPDSGATSHFVSNIDDLQNPRPCDMEVTIADGNRVRATHVGQAAIDFTSDNGTPSTLILASVYYIPGLSRRLFSLQSFTRETPFSVEITHHYTRLHFGDGETFTWPVTRNRNSADRYALSATDTAPTMPTLERQITTLPTRPISLETSMTRLGFRAAKGLLAGSLHRVWDDCHIQAGPDPYCWSARLAISRTAPRNLRRPVYYPKRPFEMVFVDVIPNPHKDTLTFLATAYDGHLLIVCPFSNYTDWRGLDSFNSGTIIKALEAFRTQTTSKGATVSLQYLRADAAPYFTSNEFIEWGNTNNIKISIAAPHHQEMNSVVERQWQNMSQIMRAILVHARLSNHFYHFAGKYAKDILNVLPTKNLLDHNNNPTTPHFKAFRTKPKIGNFRVFGCPASFKRYNATSRRTQTQQASRAIFIGFPSNQAGWLFYTEQLIGTSHIHVSHDATFDENFDSALVFDTHPFQGSLAQRRTPAAAQMQSFNEQTTTQKTGSVTDFSNTTLTTAQS
jgi:hypothetical protein